MLKRAAIVFFVGVVVGIVPSVAGAEGGNGASFCSNSGAPLRLPTGPVPGDFSTFGNAGEVISFVARGDGKPMQPGQQVKAACNPSR